MADRLFTAIATCRCPRCRKGPMFKHSAINLPKASQMHTDCPRCGFHFEIETGFFWGAMYFSYAFSVAISVIVGLLDFYLLNDPAVWVYLITIIPASIILAPWSMRYSRTLMLYAFGQVAYSPGDERQG